MENQPENIIESPGKSIPTNVESEVLNLTPVGKKFNLNVAESKGNA